MGNAARRVTNTATRPIKEYNLYERAHKAVIKNKYVPSPKHPSTQEFIQKCINELPPEVKENLSSTNPSLQERLQQVYVTSQDVTTRQPSPQQHPNRPLPLDRGHHKAPLYGFVEPKVVPYGKVTLQSALQFITAHQNDPDNNTADSIANKHKLDQRLTEQVLQHFGTFRLFVPPRQTAQQKEMLKELKATPVALPNTVELMRRLQGVAMSNTNPNTVPLQQFPEPLPRPMDSTLLTPLPTDGNFLKTEFDTGVKDEGTNQHIVQAQAVPLGDGGKDCVGRSSPDAVRPNEGGVARQSRDDVTQTKSYVPIGKDKNSDAT